MAGGTRAGRAAGSEGVKEGRCWSPAATWGPPGSGLREWWSREVEIATRESGEAEEREREEERRERERGFGPVESSRPRAEACGARTVRWWTARMKGKCGMDGRDIMGSMRQTPSPMRFTVAEGSFKCLISTHYCGRRFVLIFLSLCNCGTRIVNSWSFIYLLMITFVCYSSC
jgi:hypothetical protein